MKHRLTHKNNESSIFLVFLDICIFIPNYRKNICLCPCYLHARERTEQDCVQAMPLLNGKWHDNNRFPR